MSNASFRWEVKLEGHIFDLDRLSRTLAPGGYLLRQHDDSSWYLSGPNIECACDAKDASSRAEKIVHNVNAVFRVSRSDYDPVNIGSFVRDNEINTTFAQLKSSIGLKFRMSATLTDASGATATSLPTFGRERRWLAAAEKDPEVQAIFDLVTSGREDYDRMYRVFERIRKDLGNAEAVQELMGWGAEQYREFKGALNAPRHEEPGYKPSMGHDKAVELARELIRAWLDAK